MRELNTIILVYILTLFTITSCNGMEVPRREYVQHILDPQETPAPDIHHKSWRIVEDSEGCDVSKLFSSKKAVYRITHDHSFDTLVLPEGCELFFCGGSLNGDIMFSNNYLSGNVRLHESCLGGSVANKVFEAGWICYGDGKIDDAKGINEALNVCKTIHFQKGTYLLTSLHQPIADLADNIHEAVKSHIGINVSGISLIGDDGASLLSVDKNRTMSIYSEPNQIKSSIKGITIEGLTFRVENDGNDFNEFVHTIKTLGVNGLTIKNCQFFDYWGDAISLSHYGDDPSTGERTRNSNVTINGNYIDGGNHNNRNGISIISGYNVKITNNTFKETSRKGMPGAIDIEANNTAYTVKNIEISNNVIDNSTTCGISIYCNKKGAPAHNVTIANNSISNCYYGIKIEIYSDYSTSNFLIKNNDVVNSRKPFACWGDARSKSWKVIDNKFPGVKRANMVGDLKVERLSIR